MSIRSFPRGDAIRRDPHVLIAADSHLLDAVLVQLSHGLGCGSCASFAPVVAPSAREDGGVFVLNCYWSRCVVMRGIALICAGSAELIRRARLKQACRLRVRFCLHIAISVWRDCPQCASFRIAFLFQRHDASYSNFSLFCADAGATFCG